MLIKETQDQSGTYYRLWADLVPCDCPNDMYSLIFYSTWSNAKDPEATQVKATFLLDQDSIDNLKELLKTK